MRFGVVHRVMVDLLALLGLLALITSGEMHRWLTYILLALLAVAFLLPERYQDHLVLRRAGVVGSLSLLVIQLGRLMAGDDVLRLAVEFAAGLQVVRLLTRRGAAYDQQIILLALLHLVAGTVLGGGLAYGLCFLGFLIVAPAALVLSHLRREVEGNRQQGARDRTGLPVDVPRILRSRRVVSGKFLALTCLLSVPVFVFTAFLFVLFPRVGLSLLLLNHSRSQRMVGFSDRVDLGGVGKLRSDPTVALRVYFPELPPEPQPRLALYLRGTAFDEYDGRSWSRSVKTRNAARQSGSYVWLSGQATAPGPELMTIDLEPITPPVLFLPSEADALQVLARGEPLLGRSANVISGPEGQFEYSTEDDRGLRYRVLTTEASARTQKGLKAEVRARYLSLPQDLPPRIAELAQTWVGSTREPYEMAKRIEDQLRRNYRYDLESPSGAAMNPLDDFLFVSKRGHCEFYSTAMAILLRTLGVPTRNVTGFVGGTYNRFGEFYAVRQGDAHSWVEANVGERGWIQFDPTPPSDAAPHSDVSGALAFVRDLVEAASQRWSRHVIGYDLHQQVSLLREVSKSYTPFGRGKSGSTGLPWRRIVFAFAAFGLLLGAAYWLRRQRQKARGPELNVAHDPAKLQIIALYRQLEGALVLHGVPRLASTPPLAHAQMLASLGHPIAAEVGHLTRIYLEARFGRNPLSEGERLAFLRRTKALRQLPSPQAGSRPSRHSDAQEAA